jgi:hypothetical protein
MYNIVVKGPILESCSGDVFNELLGDFDVFDPGQIGSQFLIVARF